MPLRSELMTVSEAVEQYGPKRRWWYARIKSGDLKGHKTPGETDWLLLRSEVAAFMQAYQVTPEDRADEAAG